MAEPQDMVLEVMKEMRADMRRIEGKIDGLNERVGEVEIKLDGLTHAVIVRIRLARASA